MSEPRICEKWKDANDINFSKRELAEFKMKKEYGHSTKGLQANMRCRICAADGPREIRCQTCLKNRPIAEFSKTQRIALATARCMKCINWYTLNEPSTEVLPDINMGLHPDAVSEGMVYFGRSLNLGSDASDEQKSAWRIAHADNNTMSVPTDTSALATTAEAPKVKAATIEAATSEVSTIAPASTSEPAPTEVLNSEARILGPSSSKITTVSSAIAAAKPVSLVLPSRDIYRGPATASVGSSVKIPSIPAPSRPIPKIPMISNTVPLGNATGGPSLYKPSYLDAAKFNLKKEDNSTGGPSLSTPSYLNAAKANLKPGDSSATYHSSGMTALKNSESKSKNSEPKGKNLESKGKNSPSKETTSIRRNNDWAKPPKASKTKVARQFENYVPSDPDFYAPPENYNYEGYDSPDEA